MRGSRVFSNPVTYNQDERFSESRGQEEAACAHVFRPILRDHYSELFRMIGLNFLNAVAQPLYSYRLVYYRSSTSCSVELIAERSIKSALPFLRTSQSASFAARFRDDRQ